MEGDTYAQIHYNPDDLDDVSIAEVECGDVSEPEEMPEEKVRPDLEPEEAKEEEEKTEVQESAEPEKEIEFPEPKETEEHTDPAQEEEMENMFQESTEKETSAAWEMPEQETQTDPEPEPEPETEALNEPETGTSLLTDEIQELVKRHTESTEDIQRTLRRLEKKFSDEILNGENRDSAVKTMYKEMNEYKAGIVEKALKNVLYDIVDIRETMLSQIRFLREKKGVDVISLDEFESYAEDIGDILEKHDVTIYKGEPGAENVAVRQKIVRKVETEDDTLVKKVAESLSYGYEYGSKILYPEKISVYIKITNENERE